MKRRRPIAISSLLWQKVFSGDGVYRWFFRHLSNLKGRIAVATFLSVVAGCCSAADPLLIRYLIDATLPKRMLLPSFLLANGIAACFIARYILSGIGVLVNFRTVQIFSQKLRISVLEQLSEMSADWHESVHLGEKMSRFDQDIVQVAQFGAELGNTVSRTLSSFSVNAFVMFTLNWRIALSVLPIMPVFYWVRWRYQYELSETASDAQRAVGSASSSLAEHLAGVPQLQLLGAEEKRKDTTIAAWHAMNQAQWKQRKVEIAFSNGIMSVLSLAICIVLVLGVHEYFAGRLTTGAIVALYACTARVFDPITVAMDVYAKAKRTKASILRIKEFEELKSTVPNLGHRLVADSLKLGLVCNDVCFAYQGKPILQQVDLEVGWKEHVVLAGKSGAGKSTLARLLARVIDPTSGVVALDGIPLARYELHSLRSAICYVPQRPTLFSGTIRDNLIYGNPDASQDKIEEAIETAQLRSVVARTSNGIDTLLGPEAAGLSGGERQRLAIARAILRDSPVLVLDEATSALDLQTEEAVFRGISNLYRDRMLIIISHRLQSLTWADRIVRVDMGRMV